MNQRKHILVVEDEQHLGTGIKYNLEAEGYRVTLVTDGHTAVKVFEADHYAFDLILLDLMLPGMSGYKICETIRETESTVPILILSARSLSEDRTRGFDLGANQYLTKPFDLDELLSRVKNLLRLKTKPNIPEEKKPTTQKKVIVLEFGESFVNFETYEVCVAGTDVKLTHKELLLLRYFAENEGRVISRQELLSEVWEMNGDMQTRSVDQFMLRLRKTFEKDSASPQHFLTIRDAGYRFISNT
ncbi:MAG: response regulator transcription factor [Planctomycetota bacterium]|jgi:two-component system OmpR family response regulator|nr:response regulator transcription factor [Planctomycetota bacterium]